MNTFKKNQIIITALAIMIAIAGYLNFTDKTSLEEEQYVFNNEQGDVITVATEDGSLVPNEEELINTNVVEEQTQETIAQDVEDSDLILEVATSEETTDTEEVAQTVEVVETAEKDTTEETVGEAVLVSSTSVESSYFLGKKIEREQTRASSVDILLEVINNENLADEQKVDATSKMILLQDRMDKESSSEILLEAKGFKDVIVLMSEASVDVVVDAASLTETNLAQITEVVSRKTGIDATQIVITPLKTE